MLLFITPTAIKFIGFLIHTKRKVTYSQHFFLLILTNGKHDCLKKQTYKI